MNLTKRMRMLGLVGLVVAVSVATNLATGYVSNKQHDGFEGQQVNQRPVEYAKFSNVPSGIETDFTVAAELSVHAVVHVKTKTPVKARQFGGFPDDPFFEYFFGRPQQAPNQPKELPMQEGVGSGVIISSDGYIVTNNHVVEGSTEIEVTLNDKRMFQAKLIGNDQNTDLALLKIDADNLPVIAFGNSDSLKVGEWVLAVGNPFNLTSTVTAGIVSAKTRNINIINSPMRLESFIQTDAAVNPGNSGGALVNTRGQLVGINTAIASQTGTYAGYAFAIPVSIVEKVVSDIRKFGVVQRAVLGVEIKDIDNQLAKEKKLKTLSGAYVGKVTDQSSAKAAGVKEGDIINNVNGVPVNSATELQEQIARYRPGDKISVTVVRNDSEQKLQVQLKNRQGNTDVVSQQNMLEILGATFKEISEKTRAQLGLEYGIEIKSISKGKFADQGIKPGFIVLKINSQKINSEDDIQTAFDAAINNGQSEKVLFITGVYPNGKITYYAVNLVD
ncbi:MAG TPA: Do family serine endopeptidase [Paludibacter sp.]|nr:Do family serine endopeptidase [Paludibacter sp.]